MSLTQSTINPRGQRVKLAAEPGGFSMLLSPRFAGSGRSSPLAGKTESDLYGKGRWSERVGSAKGFGLASQLLALAGLAALAFALGSDLRARLSLFLFLLILGATAFRAARTQREEKEAALRRLREAEAEIQRTRVDPHFVFNTLNAALADMEKDPRRVMLSVGRLESFFRYSVKHRNASSVTLGEEFDHAVALLQLEKLRFEHALEFVAQIDPLARPVPVPVFLLQPLVENAVKHGRWDEINPLEIELRVTCCADEVRVVVRNTGEWHLGGGDESGGTGLEVLRSRLELLYPGRHRLEVSSGQGRVSVGVALNPGPQPVAAPQSL